MRLHLAAAVALSVLPTVLPAQDQGRPSFELYGFVMTDAGYQFKQNDPLWFDVVRPTKLPAFENQFGADGHAFFSVRQTRFGARAAIPTGLGDLRTTFEFELYGTGVDAGQTTFRLRHAYGELGKFGAGQTWSPFMDIDVFPNSIEYWGPNGMVFFRNVQVRWMPIQGDSRLTFALERPGASGDQGVYADRVELEDVVPHFPLPDLSAEYRRAAKWGYIELAGMVRWIEWEDQGEQPFDLSGDATGWGLNLSTNLKLGSRDVIRASVVYGEGIQNYMNDAPADIGIEPNPGDPVAPIRGVALPVFGVSAFLDHNWNEKFSTAIGYSMVDIDNSSGQSPSAYKRGQYALGNLLYVPVSGLTTGVEFQWGDRENFTDGFTSDDFRIQFSFKYAFQKAF